MPSSNAAAFNVADLKAQKAETIEIGWRGTVPSGLTWDVTAYQSWIDDEILSLRDVNAAPRRAARSMPTAPSTEAWSRA